MAESLDRCSPSTTYNYVSGDEPQGNKGKRLVVHDIDDLGHSSGSQVIRSLLDSVNNFWFFPGADFRSNAVQAFHTDLHSLVYNKYTSPC